MKYSVLTAACLDAKLAPQQITSILNYPTPIIQQGQYLNQFELYVILITVREWAPMFTIKNILIYCDNQTSVQVLCHG